METISYRIGTDRKFWTVQGKLHSFPHYHLQPFPLPLWETALTCGDPLCPSSCSFPVWIESWQFFFWIHTQPLIASYFLLTSSSYVWNNEQEHTYSKHNEYMWHPNIHLWNTARGPHTRPSLSVHSCTGSKQLHCRVLWTEESWLLQNEKSPAPTYYTATHR